MKILAIETSCDETAIALIEAKGEIQNPRFKILKNFVASQIKIHRPFGGIVPNLAKREHIRNLPVLFNKLINANSSKSKITVAEDNFPPGFNQKSKLQIKIQNFLKTIDLIAVTVGPGLEPALWTGINFAKDLYKELRIKNKAMPTGRQELRIIGASHLEGHLYSFLLKQKRINLEFRIKNSELFPSVALIVSGGHTILLLMKDLVHYKKLGETRDDAVGEAFDKVARLLNLSYPGGPEIEKLAKKGNPDAIHFPRPMIEQKNYDFSFSGLKTSALYYLRDNKNFKKEDVAASFQQATFDVLISKTLRALEEFSAKSIFISGGVAANLSLGKALKLRIKNSGLRINLFIPQKNFCTDNAAMIAIAGYINYLRNKKRRLTAKGNLSL